MPPNSIVTRFIYFPANEANCLPTAVDPVKVTFLTIGCGIKYSEISGEFQKQD